MGLHLYSNALLFILALIFLVLKLRKEGNGKADKNQLVIGVVIIAAITFLLPLTGINSKSLGSVGGFVFYVGIPIAVYITYHYKPEVFRVREKLVSWIILATLLTMFTIATTGCSAVETEQQKYQRELLNRPKDLPDLEKSKQRGGVTP